MTEVPIIYKPLHWSAELNDEKKFINIEFYFQSIKTRKILKNVVESNAMT